MRKLADITDVSSKKKQKKHLLYIYEEVRKNMYEGSRINRGFQMEMGLHQQSAGIKYVHVLKCSSHSFDYFYYLDHLWFWVESFYIPVLGVSWLTGEQLQHLVVIKVSSSEEHPG